MAQEMRVEHDRLTQLGWVYDGFGGYRKKAASSHPGPKIAASNVQVYGRFRPSNG
jgi:alkylated DNA repair dioxygenase AlkB